MTNVVQDLLLGGSTWPAGSYLDEVRFSAGVLGPDQFLRVLVPEPGTLAVWSLLAGLGVALGRRRGRR